MMIIKEEVEDKEEEGEEARGMRDTKKRLRIFIVREVLKVKLVKHGT